MTLKIENYGSNTEEVSFTHTCELTYTKREKVKLHKKKNINTLESQLGMDEVHLSCRFFLATKQET
jgi:hypothetical protein